MVGEKEAEIIKSICIYVRETKYQRSVLIRVCSLKSRTY